MAEHFCTEHGVPFFKKGNMKSYAHPIKDGSGITAGWCNEQEAPRASTHNIPPETDKRQASIEAQNARTNLTNLAIAGKLTEVQEIALISQLCSFALMDGDGGFVDNDGHEGKIVIEKPLVAAVKAEGGVVVATGAGTGPIKTLGDLRQKLADMGLTDQKAQKKACGLEAEEPWSNLRGDYEGAYRIVQETASSASPA
jgi:hypothetical protein